MMNALAMISHNEHCVITVSIEDMEVSAMLDTGSAVKGFLLETIKAMGLWKYVDTTKKDPRTLLRVIFVHIVSESALLYLWE
jgi:hypothetical protein